MILDQWHPPTLFGTSHCHSNLRITYEFVVRSCFVLASDIFPSLQSQEWLQHQSAAPIQTPKKRSHAERPPFDAHRVDEEIHQPTSESQPIAPLRIPKPQQQEEISTYAQLLQLKPKTPQNPSTYPRGQY